MDPSAYFKRNYFPFSHKKVKNETIFFFILLLKGKRGGGIFIAIPDFHFIRRTYKQMSLKSEGHFMIATRISHCRYIRGWVWHEAKFPFYHKKMDFPNTIYYRLSIHLFISCDTLKIFARFIQIFLFNILQSNTKGVLLKLKVKTFLN